MTAKGAKIPTTAPFNAKNIIGGFTKGFFPTGTPSDTGSETPSVFPVQNAVPPFVGLPNGFPYALQTDFTFGTLDFSAFQMVLDFIKERQNTKLIANPRIVTVNNQKATINVGRVLSLPLYERNTTTGNMEITGWEKQNVGVSLEVTPQISPDGHIKLKLKPDVSSLMGYASTRNGVNEGPITSTRTAETEVLIKDGQTVVIGGLVKEDELVKVKKIPILGDIPIVGLLFTRREVSSTANPTEKTDLLIFVTAKIIKEKAADKLVAWETNLITSPPRPFKLGMREVK